ncbi:Galactose oxidase, central domain containing protein [Novymonas esmeraldas]|uniref:Galactose oxidase, central domain containing protein n=1 Tax=Novymonas esmeraldas TaxID=1808958 RepID=A0AAW0F8S0_9TRYP
MAQPCNSLSEHAYAEASAALGKRTSPSPQGAPAPWTTSIVESTTACTEDRVFVIGGFDERTQRIVSYARVWDAATHLWARLPDTPVRVAHASAAAVPVDGSIVLFGGWDGENCNAELWHLHPYRPDTAADGAERSPAAVAAPASTRPRPAKGGEEVFYHWDRLEADPRVSARPVGRYGHAMATGMMAATARRVVSPPSPPAAGAVHFADDAAARPAASAVPAPARREPVLYVFGGNDTTSRLNDLWRLRLTPSMERRVAHWERLEVAPGVCPCPREDAALAFDSAQQCLWLFGGRTATGVLDDMWCLSLTDQSVSSGLAWTPIQPLGGHPLAPTRRDLSTGCVPGAAAVEGSCLYILFSDTQTSAKRLVSNDRVPLYCFCLTTHQWRSIPLTEEETGGTGRASSSSRGSLRPVQPFGAFRFVASCACGRFLFWLKHSAEDESTSALSTPAMVHVELNVPATKPTKRRTERNR